jgi:hypothetical protein
LPAFEVFDQRPSAELRPLSRGAVALVSEFQEREHGDRLRYLGILSGGPGRPLPESWCRLQAKSDLSPGSFNS